MRYTEDIWKVSRKHKSCTGKIMFATLIDAQASLATYKQRVVMTDMEVYYCPRHDSYHLGHARRYPERFFERLFERDRKRVERQIKILEKRREKRK